MRLFESVLALLLAVAPEVQSTPIPFSLLRRQGHSSGTGGTTCGSWPKFERWVWYTFLPTSLVDNNMAHNIQYNQTYGYMRAREPKENALLDFDQVGTAFHFDEHCHVVDDNGRTLMMMSNLRRSPVILNTWKYIEKNGYKNYAFNLTCKTDGNMDDNLSCIQDASLKVANATMRFDTATLCDDKADNDMPELYMRRPADGTLTTTTTFCADFVRMAPVRIGDVGL